MTNQFFHPGQVWLDTDGKPIQAHGGGILSDQGTHYWFGENKDGHTVYDPCKGFLHRVDVIGIACYSSQDLLNWKNEGIVLPAVKDDPTHDLHPGKVLERPKVIYNSRTRQYVMWAHVDTSDYEYARAGVAVSDRPTGPYRYLGSLQPNGADSRDMTVFQDEDSQAYLIFSSEWNRTLHIVLLDEDYVHPTGLEARILENRAREAPAMFKHNGHYFLISSGCTGWDPNPAEYAVADSPLGPWTAMHNPCVGHGARVTFNAQSTFVLPVANKPGAFIFMADQWKKENLCDSRYVWLPIQIHNDQIRIEWLERWNLSFFRPSNGSHDSSRADMPVRGDK